MPTSTTDWQMQCYGCTETDLRATVESTIKLMGAPMIVMSMLSDSQELIDRNYKDDARQMINRAKWVVSTYLTPARGQ